MSANSHFLAQGQGRTRPDATGGNAKAGGKRSIRLEEPQSAQLIAAHIPSMTDKNGKNAVAQFFPTTHGRGKGFFDREQSLREALFS